MKTLLILLGLAISVFAAADSMQEISDAEISNQLVSVAQDIRNEQVIAGVPDLQSCQQAYQRTQTARAPGAPDPGLAALETCVKTKIGSLGAQRAATLSDHLNLVTYNLIPSKSVQNVTNYLTEKLYQSLTGIDLKQKDVAQRIQAMRFKNKKQVDHKDFYVLYKTQIAKNALYEVSRFCLMDFRRHLRPTSPNPPTAPSTAPTSFSLHWGDLADFASKNPPLNSYTLHDSGEPKFEQSSPSSNSSSDPETAYRDILKNVFDKNESNASSTGIDQQRLNNFFMFCGRKINEMCKDYETKCTTGSSCPTPLSGQTLPDTALAGGSKACLAKTRLTAFRKAMTASDEIVRGISENAGRDITLALDGNEIVKRYNRGQGDEKSINELTNIASADFYQQTQGDNTSEAQNCLGNPTNCDQFAIVSDAENRIEQNTNLVYLAKREAELARVRQLVTMGGQPLEKYLEDHYPDLKDKKNDKDLEKFISQRWDARRTGMIKEIQDKIGSRQVTEKEAGVKDAKKNVAKSNAEQVLSERNRLAQVVFFNNIISSSLVLQDGSGTELGRNVQAQKNEFDSSDTIAQGVFTNLRTKLEDKDDASKDRGTSGNESISSITFLNEFIGIPKSP